ncbi:MAG: tripartite tricarboxylate transporter substrate binding protein [Rhodoplanes sp.]|nr:tripartite tricarboxylate transporter substrate binding protein [Rhodoplanes sp.]
MRRRAESGRRSIRALGRTPGCVTFLHLIRESAVELHRRQILSLAAGAVSLSALPRSAGAQVYPSRPVTLYVSYPAGTATDITLRTLTSAAEKHLGQPFVIENRPGAAGVLASQQVATSAQPDGYSIVQVPLTVFRTPFLRKTAYDPAKDFTYIIGVTGYVYGIVVRADSPFKTFQDLIAYAKANPGKISYGTNGPTSTQHVSMLQIGKHFGVDWLHVPYKGGNESINALLGGHIDAVADVTVWAPQVDAGQLRLLVTFGANRTKRWPDVPILKEVGFDLVATSPYGLAGPKGMNPAVVKTLHDALRKGMDDPAFRATMEKLDQEIWYLGSEDYRTYAIREIAAQKQVVEEFGLKQD